MTNARLWMLEAVCPRCGEHYNPHSLDAEDIQHWCDDEEFGGKPKEIWGLYLQNGGLFRKQLKRKTKLVRWKANVAAVILVAACIFGLVWMMIAMEDRDLTQGLPACPTEDSDNCYWDAQTMGDGHGDSFTVIDGEVTYW